MPIRESIMKALPKSTKKTVFNDYVFFWPTKVAPENWNKDRFPLESSDDSKKRKYDEVAPEELAAIGAVACRNKPALSPTQEAKEISRYLGWQKCSIKASEHIAACVEVALNKRKLD